MPTLKPYPAYKPAAVPWLQQVPEHWESARAKSLFRKVERPVRPEDETVTCFRDGMVTLRKNRRATGYTESLKEIGYQGIRKGDLVIHIMDAFAGSMGVSDSEGKSTPVYSVCVPRGSEVPWFFAFQLRQMAKAGWLQALSKGIRERSSDFRFELFGMQTMLVPPVDEQHLIVRYLHALDAKVKRYIRTKRTLIARLQEQKQAIIQRAVTRGLNPNVKLKPSGVEWLGEVPEHWRMTRVKSEFKNLDRVRVPLSADVRGKMSQRIFDYYGASGVIDKVEDYLFDDQLILIAEDGANLVLRNLRLVLIAQGKFWVNNHAHILKPMRGNIHYWAELLETLSYKPWITGAAQPKLTGDRLMGIALAAPDYAEQNEIVDYYMKATEPLTRTIEHEQRAVNHMLEYHTRLIADVVTGAVDVQEAAKAMKEEAPVAMEEELEIETEVEEEHGTE
jgi:type I restriction enzyme S subunit